jgi:hypothetical protein
MAASDLVSVRGQVMEYPYIPTGIKGEMVRSIQSLISSNSMSLVLESIHIVSLKSPSTHAVNKISSFSDSVLESVLNITSDLKMALNIFIMIILLTVLYLKMYFSE